MARNFSKYRNAAGELTDEIAVIAQVIDHEELCRNMGALSA